MRGETDVIDGTYDEDTAEFTFESDRFSTYAICCKDIPKQAEPEVKPRQPPDTFYYNKTAIRTGKTV